MFTIQELKTLFHGSYVLSVDGWGRGEVTFLSLNNKNQTVSLDLLARSFRAYAKGLNEQEGYRNLSFQDRIDALDLKGVFTHFYSRVDEKIPEECCFLVCIVRKVILLFQSLFGLGVRHYVTHKAKTIFCMFTHQEKENLAMRLPENDLRIQNLFKGAKRVFWFNPFSPLEIGEEAVRELPKILGPQASAPGFLCRNSTTLNHFREKLDPIIAEWLISHIH